MSERLEKIVEAGQDNRQADIELGRKLERERIAWCLRKLAENVIKPSEYREGYLQAADDVEADNWPVEWPGLIKGEN
jgi:hypothetical protein